MTWTRALVAICSVCISAAQASARPADVSCDQPQRVFVGQRVSDDRGHRAVVQPQRLSLRTVPVEVSTGIVLSFFADPPAGWFGLTRLAQVTMAPTLIDLVAAVVDITRVVAREPRPRTALQITVRNVRGTLYMSWATAGRDRVAPSEAVRLWRIAPGYVVSAARFRWVALGSVDPG